VSILNFRQETTSGSTSASPNKQAEAEKKTTGRALDAKGSTDQLLSNFLVIFFFFTFEEAISSKLRLYILSCVFSDDKFLGEFYNNSRLHHISTMGANFKSYVAELRNTDSDHTFPGREKLRKISRNRQVV
jgi:hypothetical protein